MEARLRAHGPAVGEVHVAPVRRPNLTNVALLALLARISLQLKRARHGLKPIGGDSIAPSHARSAPACSGGSNQFPLAAPIVKLKPPGPLQMGADGFGWPRFTRPQERIIIVFLPSPPAWTIMSTRPPQMSALTVQRLVYASIDVVRRCVCVPASVGMILPSCCHAI